MHNKECRPGGHLWLDKTEMDTVCGYGQSVLWIVGVLIVKSTFLKKGKSEGFYSCDQPSNLTQIGFKWLINQPV